ncbi:eukaryotic translation initiation factor 3 subunit C [Thraustotheca clavata]|uniref:Eukaryotic translation initiation factor 3 subunit C n=1 Tax=Thraustotheca clavata TaxID=74557 RepID=A0A1W0A238_9STRA|nr:eukaryotic translation initiation factor 3 subunit C [Thraustotheca clavata]
MSKFWGGSSAESESGSDSSDSEVEIVKQTGNRWVDIDSDSDSDEEGRVVVSGKDKALQALQSSCTQIANFLKINDWGKIQGEFDELAKSMTTAKSKQAIQAHGYPKYYIRSMVQLEDAMTAALKNKSDKKMSKENSKALIRMKGKIKKHNESIVKQLEEYRADPSAFESEAESSSESESSDDSDDSDSDADSDDDSDSEKSSNDESNDDSDSQKSSDADDDSDEWGSDSDASPDDASSDASSSDSSVDIPVAPKGSRRLLWVKKVVKQGKDVHQKKDKKENAVKVEKKKQVVEVKKAAVEEDLKLTKGGFDKRIKEVIALRGKRGTDVSEQLTALRKLTHYSRHLGPARELIATMYMVGAQMFDTASKIDKVLSTRLWKLAHADMQNILDILEKNPGFTLAPLTSEDQADLVLVSATRGNNDPAAEEEEEDTGAADHLPAAGGKGVIKVSGDLAAFIERLNDEYTKSLQQMDPHTSDYIARLYDEALLSELARRVQQYYIRTNDTVRAAAVALIRAELMYYKHESIANALHVSNAKRAKYGDPMLLHPAAESSNAKHVAIKAFNPSLMHPAAIMGQPTVQVESLDIETELNELCLFVYKHADDRSKTRAMLCHIYHHAVHDRFYEARDLLLMSHLQETIVHTDIATQILFNRMMAQLGLAAFRSGLMWEAHACLSEICTGSKTKELLAQGMASFRHQERDPDQERLERRRQVPYHMHINLELLELCHLTSAMLLEVPNIVLARTQDRRRVISKAFRKLLEFHDRLVFAGPPENTRDHIVSAAKAMAQGNWQESTELICGLAVWDLFPGVGIPERVKTMVRTKIQVESLRSYLMAFGDAYEALNLTQLCSMFDLDSKTVHSVVSKMMINEELQGAWDQGSQSIILHKVERTRLQLLALQFSDKIGAIVESNERMMDLRSAALSTKDELSSTRRQNENRNANARSNAQKSNNARASTTSSKGTNKGTTKRW